MERADFVQSHAEDTHEYAAILSVADALYRHLEDPDVVSAIALANLPGRSSSEVQRVFLGHARSLGFRDESKGLFAGYLTSARVPTTSFRSGIPGS